jgi:hypothetical protein
MSIPSKKIINVKEWDLAEIEYSQPIINDQETKMINIISTQFDTKTVHILTPPMNSSGMNNFVYNESNESESGAYSMLLQFPIGKHKTPGTNDLFNKLKDFENKLLDDAVANSLEWFGDELTIEQVTQNFNPILIYPKDKETNEDDLTKPASFKVIIPKSKNNWNVEIFDDNNNWLFPCADTTKTPMDFINKKSYIRTILKCTNIWIYNNTWGVTWKGITNNDDNDIPVDVLMDTPIIQDIYGSMDMCTN